MNIYDVSKKAGVSIATVSRVLNGNSNVTEKTRQKVLLAMKELDYTPNVFARGLGLNTMQTIGIMCTDSSDIYLANAVYFTEQELRKNGYDAILCCTGSSYDTKRKYLNLLLSKRVDALILVGSQFVSSSPLESNNYIISAADGIPVVLVNGYLEGDNIYSVMCNDRKAVNDAATLLINSGCRRPVYLYTSGSYSGTNKLAGFNDACVSAADILESTHSHICAKNIDSAKNYLNTIYNEGMRFDAVIASDDSLAVGAVKFAQEHRISVPEELQIIGYNNSILANCTEPELTSIDSKAELLSVEAVRLLMKVLGGEDMASSNVFTADIIKRNTTKF